MIGRLTGQATTTQTNQIILDVHGVGYLVNVPSRDLAKLNLVNTELSSVPKLTTHNSQLTTLFIHTHVKEESLDLYGFRNQPDLQLFKHLITVSGVGPKLALTILSQHTADEITSAISKADTTFFQTITGIGKKNAQKIIVELKSKFGSLQELDLSDEEQQTHQDLIAALKSLGYNMPEIKPLLKQIPPEAKTTENQLKYALKELR
jgi:Holliday junction DNA helicase RuvA